MIASNLMDAIGRHAAMGRQVAEMSRDGATLFAGEAWFDPIEAGIRDRGRGFIEELIG